MSRRTERRKRKNAPQKTISKAQELKQEADKFFDEHYKHEVTRQSYKDHYKMFIDYCRKEFRCTTKEECGEHIQDFSNWLQAKGKTPATIKTYLAPVCVYHGVKMKEIDKPPVKVSETIRSREREDKYKRTDQQYSNPAYKAAAEFQERVGIRRAELKNVRLDALKQDESGQWCIEVRKGKGGKYQLQRLLPEDVDFIRDRYFKTKGSTERIFKAEDFSNNMDYHHLRALQAQRAYEYYHNLIYNEDGSLKMAFNVDGNPILDKYGKPTTNAYVLRGELMARWNTYNKGKDGKPRKFPVNDTKGMYKLRGDNRRFALEHGLPVEYDKLCVMAVSIFHLSHWRLDTLCNYLLAV